MFESMLNICIAYLKTSHGVYSSLKLVDFKSSVPWEVRVLRRFICIISNCNYTRGTHVEMRVQVSSLNAHWTTVHGVDAWYNFVGAKESMLCGFAFVKRAPHSASQFTRLHAFPGCGETRQSRL